jgi:hypothetical protein
MRLRSYAGDGELGSNGISAAGAIGPVYKSVVDSCIGERASEKMCMAKENEMMGFARPRLEGS